LKGRLQVSGYRLKGRGYGTDVVLVDTKSNGQTSLTNPKGSVSVVANDTPYLKPVAGCLSQRLIADG
jgi:hypothetical protein